MSKTKKTKKIDLRPIVRRLYKVELENSPIKIVNRKSWKYI